MPCYLENFGLDFLLESEDSLRGIMGYTAQNGKIIKGYYGMPYILKDYGTPEMSVRVISNQDTGKQVIVGMDAHAGGSCIWEARVSQININRNDADLLQKRIVIKREDGSGGMAVVNLVNADVLPSYMEDDLITMQMVGFPVLLQYFKDEDEYAESTRDEETGKCFMLEEGVLFPSGLLQNRNPNSEHFEENEDHDDWMQVRGTVKKLYRGVFRMDDVTVNSYIRCFIDTEFGELELAHTYEQVEEPYRGNIRVGSIVHCLCVLSGDVAIRDYENGIVLDEKNDLALLRSVLAGDDPRRLGAVLCDDAVFTSESNGKQYHGRQAVIDRITTVNTRIKDDPENKCFAHFATITEVLDGEEPMPYGPDTRCLVLAYGDTDNYEGIAFIELDKTGRIARLSISKSSRYRFQIDPKPNKVSVWDKSEMPLNIVDPMLARAKFYDLIGEDMSEEELLADESDDQRYRNNIQQMLDALPDDDKREEHLRNLFGYLTAKAAESEFNYGKSLAGKLNGHLTDYSPTQAWAGEYDALLDGELYEKLKMVMNTGKLFYNDYSFQKQLRTLSEEERLDLLKTALIIAQKIGKIFARQLVSDASGEEEN